MKNYYPNMTGKICMITGANSGIGKATAEGLAKLGATVIIVCRDPDRGGRALEEVKHRSGSNHVELLLCDLSSQGAIRKLACDFQRSHGRLDILVNNAGVMCSHRTTTEDGLETTFAVNHLAYFLLTNLLLDLLKKSAPSRIINVASVAHKSGTINFEDIQMESNYGMMRAYSQSKLANIVFTYELARRLEGTSVTVNCLHPGVIGTNIARDMPKVLSLAFKLFFPSPSKGAETSIYLAASPEQQGSSGKYFVNKAEARSSHESYNQEVARRLWDVSAQLTGLSALTAQRFQ